MFVVAACLLTGCGDDSGVTGAGAGPDAPVTATQAGDSSPAEPRPRKVDPEGGLENVVPTAWTSAEVAPDGMSARLTWYSGVEECYGLDRVSVQYPPRAPNTVVVTLYAGSRPEAETCIELAEKVVTTVAFEEPLGDRELVDGALPD
jgi:hypothetical protein